MAIGRGILTALVAICPRLRVLVTARPIGMYLRSAMSAWHAELEFASLNHRSHQIQPTRVSRGTHLPLGELIGGPVCREIN
jgi:hypothetical protein